MTRSAPVSGGISGKTAGMSTAVTTAESRTKVVMAVRSPPSLAVTTGEAEAQGAKNTEETLHHAENQCAVLLAHAESRMGQASDRIVERIVMG